MWAPLLEQRAGLISGEEAPSDDTETEFNKHLKKLKAECGTSKETQDETEAKELDLSEIHG